VVWKSAVESLDHANKALQASQAARIFLEKFMSQILGILLEQRPHKIGPYERGDCILDALCKTIDIVAQDLEIQIRRNGECLLLPALLLVLNKKRPYYKCGKLTTDKNRKDGFTDASVSSRELPETRMRMIQHFRMSDGFRLLHSYMMQKIGTPAFPTVDCIHQILSATAEALVQTRNAVGTTILPVSDNQAPSAISKVLEDYAITVASVVIQSIKSIPDDDLKSMPVKEMQQMLGDLKCVFDKLVTTGRGSILDFYAFWRGLALRLVTNPSLSLKLFWMRFSRRLDCGLC
jgi:hypothetical protein